MSARRRSKQQYRVAAKHSLLPMSTKYDSRSSAISAEADDAAVMIVSLYSLSCLERAMDSSQWPFFCFDYQTLLTSLDWANTNLVQVSH